MSNIITFKTNTTIITIDHDKCAAVLENSNEPSCGFKCVKACRFYGRNILKIENNRPVLAVTDPKGIERLDNECLACEYNCSLHGTNCITIEIPVSGLNDI